MIALCIESSHERGMGHLFRGINLYRFLEQREESAVVLINQNTRALDLLEQEKIPHVVIDFDDVESDWESGLIQQYKITLWLNDKYETRRELYQHVKQNEEVVLAAIDEEGANADLLDLHFVGMVFQPDFVAQGQQVFRGTDYIILNEEIRTYRRERTEAKRIIVSMGGSDTYGVTVKILKILKNHRLSADIVVGPSFEHMQELKEELTEDYRVYQNVPSLVAMFGGYDVAITGGGVTCLEASAAGLPCIIVANEIFEIDTAKYVEELGCAVFAGYHEQIDEEKFAVEKLDIPGMSRAGLEKMTLDGAENIYRVLQKYTGNEE